MKTIHEVKKGLECCLGQYSASCGKCPYSNDGKDCGRNGVQIMKDALVYIQTLESNYSQVSKALCGKENATLEEVLQAVSQVKAEFALAVLQRDAAAADAAIGTSCNTCLHAKNHPLTNPCMACGHYHNFWEWRGVCPENTEVKEDDR